jgi:hypothetical protein
VLSLTLDERAAMIPCPGATRSGFCRPSRVVPRELNDEMAPRVTVGKKLAEAPAAVVHVVRETYDPTVTAFRAVPGSVSVIELSRPPLVPALPASTQTSRCAAVSSTQPSQRPGAGLPAAPAEPSDAAVNVNCHVSCNPVLRLNVTVAWVVALPAGTAWSCLTLTLVEVAAYVNVPWLPFATEPSVCPLGPTTEIVSPSASRYQRSTVAVVRREVDVPPDCWNVSFAVEGLPAAAVPEPCDPSVPELPAATVKTTPWPESASIAVSNAFVPSCAPTWPPKLLLITTGRPAARACETIQFQPSTIWLLARSLFTNRMSASGAIPLYAVVDPVAPRPSEAAIDVTCVPCPGALAPAPVRSSASVAAPPAPAAAHVALMQTSLGRTPELSHALICARCQRRPYE